MNQCFRFYFSQDIFAQFELSKNVIGWVVFQAELNKKINLKTSKKGPGAPVIDIFLELVKKLNDRDCQFPRSWLVWIQTNHNSASWNTFLKIKFIFVISV